MSRVDYAKNASDYGISKALPKLISLKVEKVKKKLKDLGVPDEIGLEDITLEDLMEDGVLKRRAATILIHFWAGKNFTLGLMACCDLAYSSFAIQMN